MTYEPGELARVRNPVLLLSFTAWIWLLADPGGARMHSHGAIMHLEGPPPENSLPTLLAPASPVAGWSLMLVAMMAPTLILPIAHLRLRSLKRRRARSVILFVAGYGGIWAVAGAVLLAAAMAVGLVSVNPYLAASAVICAAIVWQLSPVKQRCLNRCHAVPGLAAFGLAADLDALRFGASHGVWCAASCWALMFSALLWPEGHFTAMAIAAVLAFSERLESPAPPRWRWRGVGRLSRIAAAQTRIRLKALLCRSSGAYSPSMYE